MPDLSAELALVTVRARDRFVQALERDPATSPGTAAIEILYHVLTNTKATTVNGLTDELKSVVEAMSATDCSSTPVKSAAELFMRFISLASLEQPNFDECKRVLVDRGSMFLERVHAARGKIAELCAPFIKNGSTILTHSYSRVVCESLVRAAKQGRTFQVYVTESRPDQSGYQVRHALAECGIACTVIVDAAIAYIMEKIDFVLVGAEGVVETGGVINKIGTYTVGVCARTHNKPVYAVAESIKFVKMYPLNQSDMPPSLKYASSVLLSGRSLQDEHPLVDYTPPEYIKLLFTDLGILTPAAVSDELIKLYL